MKHGLMFSIVVALFEVADATFSSAVRKKAERQKKKRLIHFLCI